MTRNLSNEAHPGAVENLAATAPHRTTAWVVAALGTALEAVALLVLAGLSAYGVASGTASTATRALTEALVLVILGLGVGVLSKHLFARKSLVKTPTLLWNFMLLPVGYSLMTGGAPIWGWVTIALAVITFGAAVFVPRFDFDDDEDALEGVES